MQKFLLVHGPNLNLLGTREPEIYGTATLDEINQRMIDHATKHGHELHAFQSNAEHELIGQIHAAAEAGIDFIIINPAAFTHTSIALRDAMAAVNIPFIEVHLSNIFSREKFRRHSYLSEIALAVISGLGAKGYELAIDAGIDFLKNQ